jgi:hypothetical protein
MKPLPYATVVVAVLAAGSTGPAALRIGMQEDPNETNSLATGDAQAWLGLREHQNRDRC